MKNKKDKLENLFDQYNNIGQEKAKSIKGGKLTGDTKSWECAEEWGNPKYYVVDDCETAPGAAASFIAYTQY
jgi:hypothetical protein